ncbi:hypothetical protein L6164_016778 [Bauhinia variegata]|uniref:Uncharacterized protein n=1 Tax=Bauhinia variegata TaxID=167791 RepID=A0ACB9N5T3_BAUVA|nr:hypothetical protein L6164_016778 [Bauhinia variegata]
MPRLESASLHAEPLPNAPPALGKRQPRTWYYDFAEAYVFGKQLPGPGHYNHLCEEAPLLPKLGGYFTEYLLVEGCLSFFLGVWDGLLQCLAPCTRMLHERMQFSIFAAAMAKSVQTVTIFAIGANVPV